MPPRIGFKRPIPSTSRKLRPLSRRISSVEKTIDLVEDLIHFESEEDNKSTSSDQDSFSSKSPPFSPRILNTNDQGDNMDPPPAPIDEIDPMMRPRGLPIVVPPNLREIPIPTHLPKFSGSPHEDPTAHVERFEELLVSSLVTNPGHYLIWFPNTLMDSAYSWYRSHAPRTFTTWDQLQIAFLRQFRPETSQQQALAAFTNTRRGPTKDITAYVRRFQAVCTRYVGILLNDSTIRHYFIQGMDRNSTRRDVLTRRPITLANAITTALEVEVIEKEQERMERRMEEPIPSFIPITHQPNEAPRPPEMKEHYLTNTNSISFIQPTPLATREPPPLLTSMDQLQLMIQQATEGLRDEMTRTVRSLTEQVFYLIKNQAYHEFGQYTSGIWCTIQGCPNPMGHSSQFCPLLLQQQHKMTSPN